MNPHYLVINERGDFFDSNGETPIEPLEQIQELERNLKLGDDFVLTTRLNDRTFIVESFDHPLQIVQFRIYQNKIFVETKHGVQFEAVRDKWSLDEWDRFNGLTHTGAPFVLTEKTQNLFFDSVDSFDDEGFTVGGDYIPTGPYYLSAPEIAQSEFWSNIYRNEENPNWNLNQPAEAFKDMLPRLKLPKSRVLVLGAGEAHDAAFFAQAGHVVTAVDFSAEAIERGRQKYAGLDGLDFYKSDIFQLPTEWNHSFDLVVEHTCFCAVQPDQRKDLIKIYRRMLHEEGQLLGVFFTMDKRSGPPFGATEWEIRKRTQEHFQYLFWGRLRNSLPSRLGRELFVLAKKR